MLWPSFTCQPGETTSNHVCDTLSLHVAAAAAKVCMCLADSPSQKHPGSRSTVMLLDYKRQIATISDICQFISTPRPGKAKPGRHQLRLLDSLPQKTQRHRTPRKFSTHASIKLIDGVPRCQSPAIDRGRAGPAPQQWQSGAGQSTLEGLAVFCTLLAFAAPLKMIITCCVPPPCACGVPTSCRHILQAVVRWRCSYC